MAKGIIFVLIFSFFSCGTGRLLTAPDFVLYPPKIDTTKLRFDGYYSVVDEKYPSSEYTAVSEVIFTKNNKIYNSWGASITNEVFTCKRYLAITASDLGVFVILGDTIRAFVPTLITCGDGAYYNKYNLNYRGIIKNRDTIVDWHAVPPFPEKFDRSGCVFNSGQNRHTFEPQVLKFVQTDAVKCLKAE